ncbi:MAG TPA: hypothetical protein VEQ66_04075 [Propionibacteriaceae bacterium]|nr:hypothetical protein [Propionibacteriaceae bacterium]
MSESLPRRRMLAGGAAFAASAVMAAPTIAGAATRTSASGTSAGTIVRWNARTRQWAPRPPAAEFGVVFLSTNDPAATPPRDRHMQPGDVWRRHPDAEEQPEDD